MLAFQKDIDHIYEHGRERARVQPEWLVRIVSEINCGPCGGKDAVLFTCLKKEKAD